MSPGAPSHCRCPFTSPVFPHIPRASSHPRCSLTFLVFSHNPRAPSDPRCSLTSPEPPHTSGVPSHRLNSLTSAVLGQKPACPLRPLLFPHGSRIPSDPDVPSGPDPPSQPRCPARPRRGPGGACAVAVAARRAGPACSGGAMPGRRVRGRRGTGAGTRIQTGTQTPERPRAELSGGSLRCWGRREWGGGSGAADGL